MTEPEIQGPDDGADREIGPPVGDIDGGATPPPQPDPSAADIEPDIPVLGRLTRKEAQMLDAWYFRLALRAEVRRPYVTALLVLANGLVFGMMAAQGVDVVQPHTGHILAWGGLHGPNVAGGEWWRMLSATYIHIGFLHLLFNMWCLSAVGRFAERLFGHFAFLLLYTLAGIGGSVASLWADPSVVGAGASGAVFGAFGALIGFMLVRRRSFPIILFKPLMISTLLFIGYNLYFGFMAEGIDNAAHLGGLVTGLVGGALLSRRVPAHGRPRSKRRYAYATGLAAAIAVSGVWVVERIPQRFSGRPVMLTGDQVHAFAEFNRAVRPLLERSGRMAEFAHRVEQQMVQGRPPTAERQHEVRSLAEQAARDAREAKDLPVEHRDLRLLKEYAAGALEERANGFAALSRWLETGDPDDHAEFVSRQNAGNEMIRKYNTQGQRLHTPEP